MTVRWSVGVCVLCSGWIGLRRRSCFGRQWLETPGSHGMMVARRTFGSMEETFFLFPWKERIRRKNSQNHEKSYNLTRGRMHSWIVNSAEIVDSFGLVVGSVWFCFRFRIWPSSSPCPRAAAPHFSTSNVSAKSQHEACWKEATLKTTLEIFKKNTQKHL